VFGPAAATNAGCTTTTSGACSYADCTNGTTAPNVDAGTLDITGPGFPSLAVMPDGTNLYTYQSNSMTLIGGAAYGVTGMGGVVPAFGPVAIGAPSMVDLLAPSLPDGGTAVVPTVTDLTVAWSQGEAQATMFFEGSSTSGNQYFYCEWDATQEKQVVPMSVMTPLAGQTGYVVYGQYTQTTFMVGSNWTVTEQVVPYSGGTVTFQ
jgi:hypothetical protein